MSDAYASLTEAYIELSRALPCYGVLQVYNGAAAAAPRPNRTASICYDFVKGVCTRGNECRYSHDLSLIARTARSSSSGSGPATEVCYDFLRCVTESWLCVLCVQLTVV